MVPVEVTAIVEQYWVIVLIVGVLLITVGVVLRRYSVEGDAQTHARDVHFTPQQLREQCKGVLQASSGSVVECVCVYGFGEDCAQRCSQQGVDYYQAHWAGERAKREESDYGDFICWMDNKHAISASR